MKKYEHGGNIYENRIAYDFSANINPLGMPENVKEALKSRIDLFEKYPDVHCTELRNALAKKYHVLPEHIVCGNGAVDVLYKCISIIKRMCQVRKENKEEYGFHGTCLLALPCFSEYEKALLENDFEVKYYIRKEENDFRLMEDYLEYMEDIHLLILCRPNNPSGDMIEEQLLQRILNKAEQKQIFVILDECFIDFVSEKYENQYQYAKDNVMMLHAFTKMYAMAGLRLGFGISRNTELIEKIREFGAEWNVSVPAQIAGVEALKDSEYPQKTRHYVEKERNYLIRELTSIGIKVYPSQANFVLIYASEQCYELLLCKGIMIRDCSNFEGLKKGYYRIAVRTHEENEILIQALK
ncbi:MAG: aminotransferase class I/II-fold pyridoxal phosphate-dependent enzyme [Lachnospiraceae bacterium]|nr:aminotransferase class I/II-fold pyridoxal phosphate-dependent enzyme [Lachnospiraceae bacterium]